VLDEAIFSLPEAKLSQILEDERGLYIVRVTERKPAGRTPFEDAQDEIKEKITDQKKEKQFKAYLEKLRTKTPVWTIYDKDKPGQVNGG
jgi:parvulin-like peptidyl-prolyl isomerase